MDNPIIPDNARECQELGCWVTMSLFQSLDGPRKDSSAFLLEPTFASFETVD